MRKATFTSNLDRPSGTDQETTLPPSQRGSGPLNFVEDTMSGSPTPIPIDQDPNAFLLFCITYLMAAPSAFSFDTKDATGTVIVPAIIHQADPAIARFLQEAGIVDATAVE